MKQIKFLLISNMYPKNDNDFFGVFIKNIEDGLQSNGIDVDRIVIAGQGKSVREKIKKYFTFYREILKADFDKYDIVQISYPSHTYFPILFKRFHKTKFIVRLHGHDLIPISLFQKIVLLFTKMSISKADMVVLPSNYFYTELLKIGIPKDYYIYPSGGLDTQRFYPKNNTKNKTFTIGYVGRISSGKGIDVLLTAVTKLDFDFELIIVGSGELEKEMKALASRLPKEKKISFVGKIPNDKLVDFYNVFDIFIFPTMMNESFGNVAIEAMGCKLPIIGSNIGGLTDYIFDGINGYLFEPGNSDELADNITKFYKLSSTEKDTMAEEAYKVAMGYEKSSVTQGFIAKLKGLL
ncbi:glycosyltransferase family 4 protein [Sulfurovum sp. XGS-02]|uniref:glycosyltransferase family 4 protein n=1 Tax=Sulfurovum sp. XGS-02 TaxID=2925411 RepID=UPI002052FA33|nr:glycosyltransferase family 4 protein [Sulfurovum sp. XGS-02]UPT77167.1 glycosyltransferase family 4 protein [Sulfurovum sp. XGS-02]